MMNTAPTKKELVYRRLRDSLRRGALRPGDRLVEIPLAGRLGVSRIPLREAIDQLASEGLVERIPGLGSRVRSASSGELRQIYEMREVLECFTVEKAASRLSSASLGRLEDLCREMSAALDEYRRTGAWTAELRDRLVAADAAFHETIAQAAQNEPIRREIARLRLVSEILSYRPELAADETPAMLRAAREHREILGALRRGEGRLARSRITSHLRRSRDRALLVLELAERSARGADPDLRP